MRAIPGTRQAIPFRPARPRGELYCFLSTRKRPQTSVSGRIGCSPVESIITDGGAPIMRPPDLPRVRRQSDVGKTVVDPPDDFPDTLLGVVRWGLWLARPFIVLLLHGFGRAATRLPRSRFAVRISAWTAKLTRSRDELDFATLIGTFSSDPFIGTVTRVVSSSVTVGGWALTAIDSELTRRHTVRVSQNVEDWYGVMEFGLGLYSILEPGAALEFAPAARYAFQTGVAVGHRQS
jgi:hypothetical protein